jgi:hypothetical protein
VPVVIEVAGATPAFVDPAQPQRLFVALNGVPVNVPRSRWRAAPGGSGLFLEMVVSTAGTPLRAGVNVLECSVATGAGADTLGQRRASVGFVLSPQATLRPALVIDSARSVFNAPSNDHQRLLEEKIVIHNRGGKALNLTGWRLADRRRNTFVFPTFRLAPGRTVSVHTGQAGNSSARLSWGRPRAMWNKASGIVHLIDGQGFLAAFCSYRKA